MKYKIGSILALAVFVISLSVAASAQTNRYCRNRSINGRERTQQQRVYQGIRSGELTRSEAARLEAQQAHINLVEARFRASGNGLSPRERYVLERDLNRSSRNIYRQKHDRQDFPGFPR